MPTRTTGQPGIPQLPAFPDPTQYQPQQPQPGGGQTFTGSGLGFTRPAGSFNMTSSPTSALDIGINPESLPPLPGIGSYEGERAEVQDVTLERILNSLYPQFDRQEDQLLQRLANQGLDPTSEAYGQEMEWYYRSLNEALENATLQSLLAGSAEQQRLFDQGLGLRGQVAGEQLGLGGLQMQGMGIQANANIAGAQTAAQRAIAEQQLALQALNDQWARDMQGRQQYFNEMAFFGGSPGQPMLGIPSAAPINVGGAYGAYNQGYGNVNAGYNNSLNAWNAQAQAAAQPYNNLAMILGSALSGGFF